MRYSESVGGADNRALLPDRQHRMLGLIALLIGASMVLSLPWAFPLFGQAEQLEVRSLFGLLASMVVCGAVGGLLMYVGRTSAVAATLNGVGPGLGVVGESENYAHFHFGSKLVLILMMLLGRLEVFVILVLFVPRFWRSQ